MEYRIENLMQKMIDMREKHNMLFEKQGSDFSLILSLVQQLSVAVVVVNSAISVIGIEMGQGVMAAIILLSNRYFGPYQQALKTFGQWKINQTYITRLNEVLDIEEASYDNNKGDDSVKQTEEYDDLNTLPKIAFRDRELNFTLNTINVVAGKSGSGKTELLNHIQSLEIGHGEHYINHVMKVDKNSTFIEGSIIDNITCFQPSLYNAAYSLCQALSIKTKIDDLTLGFYTEIDNANQNIFSRQIFFALLIVRALLSGKKIILIDDLDLVYDHQFAQNILSCFRPRSNTYTFVIVSNKIKATNLMINQVVLGK